MNFPDFHQFPKHIVVAGCFALAGCGGGGGSDSGGSGGGTPTTTFADVDSASTTLFDTYIDASGDPISGVTVTDASAFPSGSVTYEGYIRGEYQSETLIGSVSLTSAFASDTISGSASDFYHETSGAVSGSLTGDGNINTSATGAIPQVTVNLDGTLGIDGVATDTALALDGDFLTLGTNEADAIGGQVEGTLTATGAGAVAFTDGVFVAVQD